MKFRQLGVIVLVLIVLILPFLIFVWPTFWSYEHVGPHRIRTNRLTARVQFQEGNDWKPFPNPAMTSERPTPALLKQVKIEQIAWAPSGLLWGRIYNGAAEPIRGRIVFHITVLVKGKVETPDREIPRSVDWPPGQASEFIFQTDLQPAGPTDITKLELIAKP